MNISSLKINRAKGPAAGPATRRETAAAAGATALMSCELCGLSGGPFAPAEAAHLRAIHDRMFHGFSSAA